MESCPTSRLVCDGLAAASATTASRLRYKTVPGGGLPPGNHPAPLPAHQANVVGMVRLVGAGSPAAGPNAERRRWATTTSASYAGHWVFAQALAPDDDDDGQDEGEDEEEAGAEPQSRQAMRKQSATEDDAEQLRGGGTINPPFP